MLYNDLNYFYNQENIINIYEKCQELPFVGPQTRLKESFELGPALARSWPGPCSLCDLGDSLLFLPDLWLPGETRRWTSEAH